ncbi:alginate export family protein [Sphingobium yanoikuyae]|uniref:alginate export family protein n=1 Tax=Sphingobium yanoikuyae TaxID=13690 RepID=UPI0022DE8233|nr:alginate export family protein [Sphingobium yanoikuyae]WBQ15729.1 alginate export family protein [Sphingobium yanoikuyae]
MSRRFSRIAGRLTCTATLSLALATPALAQSVAPDDAAKTSSGGPQGSASPPGIRPAKSQGAPAEAIPGGRKGPPGVPQAIRWTEDWSKTPAPDAPIFDKIRHIPLDDDNGVYLSLGGEARVYYTNWHHSTLGLRANDSNDPVQTRLRLIGDLHLGPNVRAYLELGDNREYGEQFATAPNRDKLDIYQAFMDVTIPLGETSKITFRPGRFEMPLGNGKLVGVREGLNMRFTYQGLRATYILPGKLSVDAFALRPVAITPDSFDDTGDSSKSFEGVYVSSPKGIGGIGTDVYWYEMDRQTAALREGTGEDRRTNWGTRLWKRTPKVDFDLEGTLQRGSFANQDIRAWGLMLEAGYSWPSLPMKPRLGLRANAFSGDDDLSDGKAGTFVAASPRLPLISEAAFFNFSNLVDLYPSVTLKPVDNVTLMAGPDFLWRQSKADGVYIGPAGSSFAPYDGSRYIGTDFNLEASWQMTKRLSFRLYETYFAAGSTFEQHGGKNGNYFGIMSNYRF